MTYRLTIARVEESAITRKALRLSFHTFVSKTTFLKRQGNTFYCTGIVALRACLTLTSAGRNIQFDYQKYGLYFTFATELCAQSTGAFCTLSDGFFAPRRSPNSPI